MYDIVEGTEGNFIEILFKSRGYDFYIRESLVISRVLQTMGIPFVPRVVVVADSRRLHTS